MERGMTRYREGDIVVIPFPYTDLAARKQRPALVLSPSWYNESHDDALFAYMTSVPQDDAHALPVAKGHLSRGGLVKDSWVRVDKLFALEQVLVRKAVGRLQTATLDQVRERACRLIRGERPDG